MSQVFKLHDIVTVLTPNGEYVGKFQVQDGDTVTLRDPRFVSVTEQGMGFANGISMTGPANPDLTTFYNISILQHTNQEVAEAYRQMTGSIAMPNTSSLIT